MHTSPKRKEFDLENDDLADLYEMNTTIQSCMEQPTSALLRGPSSEEMDQRTALVSTSVVDLVYDPIRSELEKLRKSAATEFM